VFVGHRVPLLLRRRAEAFVKNQDRSPRKGRRDPENQLYQFGIELEVQSNPAECRALHHADQRIMAKPRCGSTALLCCRSAPSTTVDAAKAAASCAGARRPRRCRDFAASGLHRFTPAPAKAQEWKCTPVDGLVIYGFAWRAICTLDEREQIERE
jgi:hypothetical protein